MTTTPAPIWASPCPTSPNLFLVYGPNTNLGHGGSVIFHTECQVSYITKMLVAMLEGGGVGTVEVRPEVCDATTSAWTPRTPSWSGPTRA